MAVRRLAPADIQPKKFAFTAANLEWAKGQLKKYPEGRQISAAAITSSFAARRPACCAARRT
jgi:hypothetical protein